MDVKLVVQSGGRARREIPVDIEEFVIGRDLGCHFRVDHDRVGSHHCRIRLKKNRVVVEDLNSIHGTLVNDQAVRSVEAHDGDRLRVGPTTFLFVIGSEDGPKNQDDGQTSGFFATRTVRAPTNNPLDSAYESAVVGSARNLLARMTGILEEVERPLDRLRIVESRGVSVIRLLEEVLVEHSDVDQLSHALDGLIGSGKVCIAVNFEVVENLAVQAIGVLASAHDRCRAGGGLLKLCGIGRQVGQSLAIIGMDRFFEIAPDELSAVEGNWPGAPLAAATATATAPPLAAAPPAAPPLAAPWVRLLVMTGKARGKAIEIGTPKFLIGRDPSCHLRPNSPTISRLHTTIEQRDGRVFVRDLGAKNSTILNDRVLQGEEAEAIHGDRLQVGPLLFTFALGDHEPDAGARTSTDSAPQWLLPEKDDDAGEATTLMSQTMIQPPAPLAAPSARPPAPLTNLAAEVVGQALVVTILASEMNDEPTVGPVRYELCELFDRPVPRRVVISLERVRYLSSRGVGVLLAHFQRLGRAGGAMRLCQIHPNVEAVLEQMRVPMLIEVFPTVADALAEPWE